MPDIAFDRVGGAMRKDDDGSAAPALVFGLGVGVLAGEAPFAWQEPSSGLEITHLGSPALAPRGVSCLFQKVAHLVLVSSLRKLHRFGGFVRRLDSFSPRGEQVAIIAAGKR